MLAMYLSRLHNKEALYETIGRIKQEPPGLCMFG